MKIHHNPCCVNFVEPSPAHERPEGVTVMPVTALDPKPAPAGLGEHRHGMGYAGGVPVLFPAVLGLDAVSSSRTASDGSSKTDSMRASRSGSPQTARSASLRLPGRVVSMRSLSRAGRSEPLDSLGSPAPSIATDAAGAVSFIHNDVSKDTASRRSCSIQQLSDER